MNFSEEITTPSTIVSDEDIKKFNKRKSIPTTTPPDNDYRYEITFYEQYKKDPSMLRSILMENIKIAKGKNDVLVNEVLNLNLDYGKLCSPVTIIEWSRNKKDV